MKFQPDRGTLLALAGIFIFFLIALMTQHDPGLGWDEPQQRIIGQMNFNYAFNGDPSLLEFKDRDHGASFEALLIVIEKLFKLSSDREIYMSRHIVSHLFYLLGAFIFYLILRRQFRNPYLALTGLGCLLLTPVIYGHSFINSKDIPFMTMMIASQYTLIRANSEKRSSYIIHGLITGIMLTIRLMGLLMVALTLLKIVYDAWSQQKVRAAIFSSIVFLLFCFAAIYIFWPFLWSDPVHHFIYSFKSMAAFNWDDPVLFMGNQIPAPDLPWFYLPVSMITTVPVVYTMFFTAGILFLISYPIIRKNKEFVNTITFNDLAFVMIVFLPFLSIEILDSTVYDGWRHIFFLYPSFIYIAILGLSAAMRYFDHKKIISTALWTIISIQMIVTSVNMIKIHPYQYIHYNILIDKGTEQVRQNYEMDYWGTSYMEAFEYILSHDSSRSIKIMVANNPGIFNSSLLNEEEIKRADIQLFHEEPDYFISNYRFHPEDYPYGEPWYSKKIMNSSVFSIWKMD